MTEPFYLSEEHAIDLVAYVFGYGLCPYCHKKFDVLPDGATYSTHLITCIHRLENEKIKTRKT